ncbi:hypothetical protein AVEN_174434-1 [Araneus ventricosus]|uniref:Uncharacterized protein n=1 Tax=Araneus ventricosus TaxID=182803 RepID=A0A4Y2V904_ARAVE|nr:hypothetical protein AVEN_160255-1 [Araneus ventricosus]GBO20207.1 hypothetical protein AVEN_174434-1 [Araneus ventricosus]
MEEASRSCTPELSRSSTPRSWTITFEDLVRERAVCSEITELDENWKQLDARLTRNIECLEGLQKLGKVSPPEYNKLASEEKKLQNRIDVIEDALERIGECPYSLF